MTNKIVKLWKVTEETFDVRYFKYEDYDLAVEYTLQEIKRKAINNTEFFGFSLYYANIREDEVAGLLSFRREDDNES